MAHRQLRRAALLFAFAVLPVVQGCAADWTVVKGSAPTAMDSLAATELQKYVGQMTGKRVPVITDDQTPTTSGIFLVGKVETNRIIKDLARRRLVKITATEPGPQGFINKTVDADGKHYVVLAGCDELGVQYAVYDFLESTCKVGFLLDGENVPSVESLEVKELDVSKRPFCAFRQQSVYGKGKLWYGFGTCASLTTIEKDGYRTGWRDFIDWMLKKKQNVLYLKRGFFNIGYIGGFPELNNAADVAAIDAEGFWFTSAYATACAKEIIAYAKSRGMKTCYTATICRMPKCFRKCIEDPRHPCFGLKYEDKGTWIRLDPLDERSYSYCLRRQAEAIVAKFGKPDFWYGYYGWSEQPLSRGLKARSTCHYKAYDLCFKHVGGSLLVYTWDWGGFGGVPLADEWAHYKSVMPKDGSVILVVNDLIIPAPFLSDPAGPFAGYPWWKYLTTTADDQCLPETFRQLTTAYNTWRKVLGTCRANPPSGFGIDNMIHHVDQRLTDFECDQSFAGNADRMPLDDYLADYTRRAYGGGAPFDNLLAAQKLWANQKRLTIPQVEQYMVPEWPRLKDNLIYRTDLTEALCYEASDHDKCALLHGKWIYSNAFTRDWAAANVPVTAWTAGGQRLWESLVMGFPSGMTYENKARLLADIRPGTLTVHVVDTQGRPVPNARMLVTRGYLTRIQSPDRFELTSDQQGEAETSLMPDIYVVTVAGSQVSGAVLMLHKRDKVVTVRGDRLTVAAEPADMPLSSIPSFRATVPPSLTVHVSPGQASLPSGRKVRFERTDLTFDQPEVGQWALEATVPQDYSSQIAARGFWVYNSPQCITLLPPADTPILGALYRSVIADSIVVTSADGRKTFREGQDYILNPIWGQLSPLSKRLGVAGKDRLRVSFQYVKQRIDLIQMNADGKLTVRKGKSAVVCPERPDPDPGCVPLAGIWVCGAHDTDRDPRNPAKTCAIRQEDIYPIRPTPPVSPINGHAIAKTLAKLKAGETVGILFFGDSITAGAEASHRSKAFTALVMEALRKRYPGARITEFHASRGGMDESNTRALFEQSVLPLAPSREVKPGEARADLLVLAFTGMQNANNRLPELKAYWTRFVTDAKQAGMDVLLVTKMQTITLDGRPGTTPQRDTMIEVALKENVACADVHTAWLNLAAQGIPPQSQLHNWANHPGDFGMRVYAETILRVFGVEPAR